MSRGFVKEEDQEEIPMVPPRADLPPGVPNYMTEEGMRLLLPEKEGLLSEKNNLSTVNENEKRIATNFINAKLKLLGDRISEAKIIDLKDQPKDEIRFGATIILKIAKTNKKQKFQIVGVDEADISKGKISFISPIAKILIEKKVGEKAILKLAMEDRIFEILDISYE